MKMKEDLVFIEDCKLGSFGFGITSKDISE